MKKITITLVILLMCCITACSTPTKVEEILTPVVEEERTSAVHPNPLLDTIAYEVTGTDRTDADAQLPEKDRDKRETLGLNEEGLKSLEAAQSGLYAYDMLEETLHPLYVEILTILQNREQEVVVSSTSPSEIDKVFQCVLNDHPEIYYVKGYEYTKHSMEQEVLRISLTGTYTMDTPQIEQMNAAIEAYATTCLGGLPPNSDEYEKVRYIYEYLVSHTQYQLQAPENQNICSVFVYGKSVCQGYAKAMQFLLNRCGVNTTLVLGYVDNGDGHAWNLVQIDGAYYYVDVTWGDAYYEFNEGEVQAEVQNLPTINYDYLCVTTDQLCKTHRIDNVVPMPRCVSMDANYYVREGAYFTEYADEQVVALFFKAYESGIPYVTLKCASLEVYNQMEESLIANQKVFQYLQSGDGSIAYTGSEEQLTFSFWL
ncbi:MAG: transglutaminase domain-containing protein [Lachnospiraceae bacterium]